MSARRGVGLGAVLALLACACAGGGDIAPPASTPEVSPAATGAERRGETLRVAVISDLNGHYGSTEYGAEVHAAVERIVALHPDLVLATGDLVAGQRAGVDYRAMWRAFHAAVTERLRAAGIPLAVTPGNHDASGYARYADERAIFVDEWRERRLSGVEMLDVADHPLRYAFALGPALFVSLDATVVGPLEEAQRAWLEARLADARGRRVVIVIGHLPLRPITHGREREVLADDALVSILAAHEVDAYLSGHHHAFYPGRIGELATISVGCLGAGPRALLDPDAAAAPEPAPRSFLWLELDANGIVRLEALAEPAFDRAVEIGSLPPRVGLGQVWTERDERWSSSPD